jgi:hypothetical protein
MNRMLHMNGFAPWRESLANCGRSCPSLAFAVGAVSLTAGSISVLMAGSLIALGIAEPAGLLQGSGGRSLADTLFGPILLVVWVHGLEPRPEWNYLPAMFSAIAGSLRVYTLPGVALGLGLLGRRLSTSGADSGTETRLARAALRQSRAGIFLGAAAVVMLLGLLLVGRLA